MEKEKLQLVLTEVSVMTPDERIMLLAKRVNDCERMQSRIREQGQKLEIEVIVLMVLTISLIILIAAVRWW